MVLWKGEEMKKLKKLLFLVSFVFCMMLASTVHAKAAAGVLFVNGAKQDKAAVNSMQIVRKSLDTSIWSNSKKSTYSYSYAAGIKAAKLDEAISKAYSGNSKSSCFFYFVGNGSDAGISLNGNSVYKYKNLAKKLYSVNCSTMVVVLDTPYASKFINAAKSVDKKGKFVIFAGSQQMIKPFKNYYRFSRAFANGLGVDNYLMYGDMNHNRVITASEMNEYCTAQLGNDLLSGAGVNQKCQLYAKNKNFAISEYGVSIGNSSTNYLGTVNMNVNNSMQLYPYVINNKGNASKAKWSSSDSSVVSVSKSGKMTGKKAGSVTITVSYRGVKGTCRVTVGKQNNTDSAAYPDGVKKLINFLKKNGRKWTDSNGAATYTTYTLNYTWADGKKAEFTYQTGSDNTESVNMYYFTADHTWENRDFILLSWRPKSGKSDTDYYMSVHYMFGKDSSMYV